MNNRKAFSREKTVEKLNEILPKFTIIVLAYDDVKKGLNFLNGDVEDSVHYVLSVKRKCDTILTNNRSDFTFFKTAITLSPKMGIGVIKSYIK